MYWGTHSTVTIANEEVTVQSTSRVPYREPHIVCAWESGNEKEEDRKGGGVGGGGHSLRRSHHLFSSTTIYTCTTTYTCTTILYTHEQPYDTCIHMQSICIGILGGNVNKKNLKFLKHATLVHRFQSSTFGQGGGLKNCGSGWWEGEGGCFGLD